MADRLGIFARAPTPGLVKTRLTPGLSPLEAAAVYEACLKDIVDLTRTATERRVLFFDPAAGAAEYFEERFPQIESRPQEGDDLGHRLTAAFDFLFQDSPGAAAIIGTDSPTLPSSSVQGAAVDPGDADVALGPTLDGGYYLVGIAREGWPRAKNLFRDIPWSSDRVFSTTLERARGAGLRVRLLAEWYDIDRVEDLARAALDASPESHLGRLLRKMGRI